MVQIRVSVIVPTRNRADHIGPCVASILANPERDIELIVVDQSDTDESARALATYRRDERVHYLRSETRGAASARNVAIAASRGPLLAFTDDDCRVPQDWIAGVLRIFESDQGAGLVFGRVDIPDGALEDGFLAAFKPVRRSYEGSFPQGLEPWGISANMGVRRELIDDVGLFDPLLGPGSKFKAGEDVDFAIRAIAHKWRVVMADEVRLLHLGVRSGEAARQLLLGYMFATGAVFAKHVRLRTPGASAMAARFLVMQIDTVARAAAKRTRPLGLNQLLSLLSGARQSLKHAIDPQGEIYI